MRRLLLTLFSVGALSLLTACGSSSSNGTFTTVPSPPSSGNNAGYSTSNLNGTYVFAANGTNTTNLYAVAGTFTADGKGNITSGTRDTTNDGGGQALNETITGSYSVNQDGRGQMVLNGSSTGRVIYRFTMRADGEASMFEISNTADSTGRIIPLPNSLPQIALAQVTYAIRLDGEDQGLNIYGAVGALTFNYAANTVTGTIDENDNGAFRPQLPATGSINFGTSRRGTVSYTSNGVTHNFAVYPLAQNRIELISTDRNFFLHGYGYEQTSIASTVATFKGDQVFSISGFSSSGPIIETGRMTLDGTGAITNAIEDYNEAGSYFDSVAFGGSYSVGTNGRWTATLNYSSSSLNLVGWQASSQTSLVMVTGSSISNFGIVETGTMRAQTTGLTVANISGNYAEHLSGTLATGGTVESGGNFDADGAGNLIGTIDSQTPSSINTDVAQSGNYSVASNGRSSGTIGAVPVHLYTVDANTIYLISTDPVRIYQGMMNKQ